MKKTPQKVEVKDNTALRDFTKKKLKNDIDKITKAVVRLQDSIDKHNETLQEQKDRLIQLGKEKEELVLLNNQI